MSKVVLAGISWFNSDDYPRILEIMVDAHIFPRTYDLWRKKAEDDERRAQARGFTVIRAIINPDEFIAWCAREGLAVDAKARTAFAADFAARRLKN